MPILRPYLADGSGWTNPKNIFDGNTETSGTVLVRSSNYSERVLTLNFDFPSIGTISSMKLYVIAKGKINISTTLSMYLDINGDPSERVINQTPSTSAATSYSADISSYKPSSTTPLSTITLTPYSSSRFTDNTLEIFELYIEYELDASVSYTVRFLDYDNRVISEQSIPLGGAASAPDNPIRTGYTFVGWDDNEYDVITSDKDIKALYKINTYNIRFLDYDDTVLSSQTVTYGGNAIPPSNPKRYSYVFNGWDSSYENISESKDIKAQYTFYYIAYFIDWNGTILSEYHSSSQNFKPTLPNNPSREGYTFIGWDSDINNVPDTKEIFALYEMNDSTGKRSIESMFHNCSSFNKECIVNSSLTNTNNLFNHCNSLNSDIHLHFSEEKNTSNIYNMLTNTSVNMVYIKDYIDANIMNIFLDGLTNVTTIDIRENSLANILTIIDNDEIMNKINYGIKGISHTLLWKDENYNYFNIVTNDTVGYQVTLYQPSLMSSEATLLESDLLTDWGDGTIDNLTSHTYSSSNNYLIKTKLSPGSGSGGSNNLNIIECENIRTGITDMDYFFSNCINLTEIKNFPDSITSLNHTFENCSSFISNIKIPTNVTSIDYLFSGCSSFKQSIITIPGSITSMNGTFNRCTSLTNLNLSDSNVNAVTSMNNLFANCTSLKLLDLTNWNLRNISSASNMFTNDSNLNEIYMNNSDYSSINKILNNLPTRTKATAGFVFVDDLDNVNTSIANNVFWGVVSKFNYLTVTISRSNTKLSLLRNNRTNGTYEDLYETNWGDGTIDSADNHTYSSAGTYTVKTKLQPGNKDVSANVIEKPNDDTLITGIQSVRYDIESMDSFFFRLGNINNIDLTLNCNTKNVTQMRRLFGRSKNITYLDISNWNVENVTALSGAFTQDPLSSYFDISKWNPKNLVNAYQMFYGEYGFNVQFTSLDLSGWDTSKLENISNMFNSCTKLTTLNLSNWNLASVNNTADTFTNCSSLNSLIMKNSNAKSINLIISLLPSRSSGSAGTITVSDTTGIDTSAATSKNWNIVVE